MRRPPLREIQLSEALPLQRGELTVTMSKRQWDALLQAAYDTGAILLELDADEKPARAFQRATTGRPS